MATRGALDHLVHVARALRWTQFLPSGAIAIGIAWLITRQPESIAARHSLIRMALLVAVLGITFVFDDEAASLSQASPLPLHRRRALRALVGSVPPILLMAAVLFVAGADLGQTTGDPAVAPIRFPYFRFFLEGATIATWSLLAAALVTRENPGQAGRTASAVILAIWAASWMLPDLATPWTLPGGQRWSSTNVLWWILLILGVTSAAFASWDTRRRVLRTRTLLG